MHKLSLLTSVYTYAYTNCHYLLVKKPENAQFIHPPMTIIGKTLVTLPFNISVIMVGSVEVNIQQMFNLNSSITDIFKNMYWGLKNYVSKSSQI